MVSPDQEAYCTVRTCLILLIEQPEKQETKLPVALDER